MRRCHTLLYLAMRQPGSPSLSDANQIFLAQSCCDRGPRDIRDFASWPTRLAGAGAPNPCVSLPG